MYKKAIYLYSSKDYSNSLTLFQEIQILEGDTSQVLLKIANCFLRIERFEDAILNFKKCLDLDPKNFQAMNNLGYVYFKTKKYREAETLWEKIIEINPNSEVAKLNSSRLQKIK
ncbi:MAG: tetratricopeptide repeat protein [Leptospiraceae bacterium]|nr:tetratricopeptide repeat protein [Leptospiraceae bacterium]MCK6379687.1 tetratricopeptide repeat protein [Leptospiraceae bacterium]NUM41578.1 tetratricopeptide repeat protein [Leptospiraceae bacterium]